MNVPFGLITERYMGPGIGKYKLYGKLCRQIGRENVSVSNVATREVRICDLLNWLRFEAGFVFIRAEYVRRMNSKLYFKVKRNKL